MKKTDNDGSVNESNLSYTLDELVSKITSENIHSETLSGPPIGKEIW